MGVTEELKRVRSTARLLYAIHHTYTIGSWQYHGHRRKGRGHGALCAIQHLGVVGEPGGSGRGERVRGAINNRAPHRSPRSRRRRAHVKNKSPLHFKPQAQRC